MPLSDSALFPQGGRVGPGNFSGLGGLKKTDMHCPLQWLTDVPGLVERVGLGVQPKAILAGCKLALDALVTE